MRRSLPLVTLAQSDRTALVALRDHDRRPYLRERAATILKLGDGATIQEVAAAGLLKPRARHTIADWLDRYLAEGIAGLPIRPGRGRKPAFSPTGTGRPHGQDESAPSPHP